MQRFGRDTYLGLVQDERVTFQAEVRSTDLNGAESFHGVPTKGRLPEAEDEVAVSTVLLDAMGISHTIGEEITLQIWMDRSDVSDTLITATFRLCGWWEGDVSDLSQFVWVSEAFADPYIQNITRSQLEEGNMCGAVSFSVWYKNLWDIQGKTDRLGRSCGFTATGERGKGFQVNPAYEIMIGEGRVSFSGAAALALLIMAAGYLIIYNIFNISVRTDIRAYGLLKNVGTTGRKLTRIVRMQALRLCAVGIPAGLLLGYGAGIVLAPTLTADLENAGRISGTVVSGNPLIFAVSALFALITVYLSSLQACRIVARVSSVEALRLADGEQTVKKSKKTLSVSWWGMALENLRRSWKKGMIVMLSIAISLVTVNGIWMMVQGYDFDTYKSIYLASDFELDKLPATAEFAQLNGVTQETQKKLDVCPYAESVGYVRYSRECHEMETELLAVWDQIVQEHEDWGSYWQGIWQKMKETNQMEITLMGISQSVFEKLEWLDKEHTWEEFKSGKYVVVDYPLFSSEGVSNYHPGDTFSMEYQSGVKRSYQVLAEASLPYSLRYPYANLIQVTVMIPEEEFISCTGSTAAMYASIDAISGQEKRVQQYLMDTVLAGDSTLLLRSVVNLRASFDRFLNKYYIIGGALAAVLALIGIMNFFNTTAASVLSRRRELALLESVGMTKRQIRKMLAAEGCLYLGGAFLAALVITYLYAGKLLVSVLGRAFFFHIKVTVLPSVILLPALIAIAFAIPGYQFRKMSQESVVERIRSE